MEQRDTIEVAELLARLTRAEQEAAEHAARTAALAEDVHGQRRFSQGEVSASGSPAARTPTANSATCSTSGVTRRAA
ncbi:hypothetical protein [Gandjariella thermophila]|uniref:Uncharacterized protein n=1 Tax=Gandjariella thermophila TaxID=1931992 RepID=A0A4D4J7X2_9PSEU|nr:hypothetical protein [Gandjariella thermophila]GDY32875.1 hypothetical protein GTS_45080 [Gandjariella thermophila]